MGIRLFSTGSYDRGNCGCGSCSTPMSPNPDPSRWNYVKSEEHGNYCAIMLHYQGCTNFEGKKILVFKAKTVDVLAQKEIDPHFSRDTLKHYPIARFIPTDEGWQDAVTYIKSK